MNEIKQAEPLSASEANKLSQLEVVIERNMTSFVEAGNALSEIRDSKLYRSTDRTFSEYCLRRWNYTDRYARDLIASANVVATLAESSSDKSGTIVPLPETESQAREVAKVPPEKQAKVWKKAVRTAPKDNQGKPKVTAAHVKRVVEEVLSPEPSLPTDKVGTSLPPALTASFANAKRFDKALSLLSQAIAEINPLLGDAKDQEPIAGGERLAGERQDVLGAYKKLRGLIADYRPYAVCPFPHGARKCSACDGLGWLTERQYDRVPSNLKSKGAA